ANQRALVRGGGGEAMSHAPGAPRVARRKRKRVPFVLIRLSDSAPGGAAIVTALPVNDGAIVGGWRRKNVTEVSPEFYGTTGHHGIQCRWESFHDVELRWHA